jgi:ribonuclease Z
LGANEFTGNLQIYGPDKTGEFLDKMLHAFLLEEKINISPHEVSKGTFLDSKHYKIEAFPLKHSAKTLAYKFIEKDIRKMNMAYLKKIGLTRHPILKKLQEGKDITWKGKKIKVKDATVVKKGKIITIISDTKYFKELSDFAKGSDILVCEATYSDKLKDKAEKHTHMTATQAAGIAKDAKAKKLFLIHFSQRYKSVAELKKEAKAVFRNTECAKDFMEVSL